MAGRAVQQVAVAAVAVAAAATLSACSGSTPTGSGNFPTNNVLPTSLPTQTIDSSISGSQVLTVSLNDVAKAKAFRIVETTTTKKVTTKIDMRYGPTGAIGTISTGASVLQLIHVGTGTYVKAPDSFWKSQLSTIQLAKYGSKVHNAWVRVPTLGATFGQLSAFTDRQQVVQGLVHKDTSKFLRGPTKIVDGVTTVRLTDSVKGTVIYVALTGTPYPIEVVGAKGTAAVAHFSEWDKQFVVTAPAGAFILPAS